MSALTQLICRLAARSSDNENLARMTKQQSAKRQSSPDGLHEFEAALRAAGREPLLEWAKEAPPGKEYVEHARYNVGPGWLYVQALRVGGWRAFVPSADNDIDEVITALDRNQTARRDLAGRQIHRRARSSG
jgi:hypothetical protein